MSDLSAFLAFSFGLLATVGAGEGLRAFVGWRAEASRRFVHAMTGVLVAASPLIFAQPTGIYVLAGAFVVVNGWAVPRRVFPGMHAIQRRSWGTVTFPLALLFALWTCWTLDPSRVFILQIAFLVLAFADPLAATIGETVSNPGRYRIGANEKSVAGSLAFCGTAFGVVAIGLLALGPPLSVGSVLLAAVVVAVVATGAEALAEHGWDNFFIVVAVVAPLTVLHGDPGSVMLLVISLGVAVGFGLVAYWARSLDGSGAVAAAALAFSVVVAGPAWAVPGTVFFVLSSVLSKIGRRRKAATEALTEKGSRRDAGQVYANGGVAWALLIAYVFVPADMLFWAYVGAFAAAAADTWGTEIGTLVGGPTRLVWSGRRVPPGTSGGVSVAGTLGAVAGAVAVVCSALPFAGLFAGQVSLLPLAATIVAGAVASALLDSLIGATAQAIYQNEQGGLTERTGTDRQSYTLVRGRRWITNDRVNLACTMSGASLAAAAALFA